VSRLPDAPAASRDSGNRNAVNDHDPVLHRGPSSAPDIRGLRCTASHDASVLVRSMRSGYCRAAVAMTNSPGTR
jgi:hypothetical protein